MEILREGHKTLKKKAKRVDKIDDTIRNIAASMVETMINANGIGISGNQIGVLKRIIVVMVNENPTVMVNPEIVFEGMETCTESEGCLSFPETFLDIERPTSVTVKYRNLAGHPKIETYTDLTARCIFHEIDHLNGIVFTEHMDT
jgi:peptide deformylase